MWSKGEEITRVLVFLCLNKVVLIFKKSLFEFCMKVRNGCFNNFIK